MLTRALVGSLLVPDVDAADVLGRGGAYSAGDQRGVRSAFGHPLEGQLDLPVVALVVEVAEDDTRLLQQLADLGIPGLGRP